MNWDTTDSLRGCARFLMENHPSGEPDVDFIVYGIATEFLRAFVGNEWTNQMIFGEHRSIDRRNRMGRVFMRAESDVSDERYRNQQRTLRIAELLFNLQNVEGIVTKVEDLRSGNIEATYSELEAGGFLLRRSLKFGYKIPSGTKGADFDIEILLPDAAKLNCEIKCKVESTDLSEGAVRNPLQDARRQLPSGEPGLVFLKLPEVWVHNPNFASVLRSTIDAFLRGTSRVIAVVLRWEEQFRLGSSGGALTLYKFHVALGEFRKPVPQPVETVLQALSGPATAPLVSFRKISKEVLQG